MSISWEQTHARNPARFERLLREWSSWNRMGHKESREAYDERACLGVNAYINGLPPPPHPSPPPPELIPVSDCKTWQETAQCDPERFHTLIQEWYAWNPRGYKESYQEYRARARLGVHAYRNRLPPPPHPSPPPPELDDGSATTSAHGTAVQQPSPSPPPPPPTVLPATPVEVPNLWTLFMYRWHKTVHMYPGETREMYRARASDVYHDTVRSMTEHEKSQFRLSLWEWFDIYESLPNAVSLH